MADEKEKRISPTIRHTDKVKWIRTGRTKKGADYVSWQMGSLSTMDGDTRVYQDIRCFSMAGDVVRLLLNCAEDSTKVTVRGDVGLDSYKGKMRLSVFVHKAWVGQAEDEPPDGVDPVTAANANPPKKSAEDIPF